jgi:hypothetical protein
MTGVGYMKTKPIKEALFFERGCFGILLMSDVVLISGKTLSVDLETARGWIKSCNG